MTNPFLTTLKELREKATAQQIAIGLRPGIIWLKEKGFENDADVRAFARCWNSEDAALIVHLVNHAPLIEELVEALERIEKAQLHHDDGIIDVDAVLVMQDIAANALSKLEGKS